jgi:vacuolar-type H+-ATPase subunit F/Vma7
MGGAVYIGDEAHAAGWRLAGIEARSAADGDIGPLLVAACASADLVLLSAASAARLPPDALDRVRRAPSPLLLVLPDAAAADESSELAQRVRRQLGMEP